MALKGDRQVNEVEIGYFLNQAADAGVIAVAPSIAGSGVALDSTSNVVTISATPSGQRPMGLLLNEFVIVDQTKFHENFYKDQAVSGSKATLLTDGWVVTDKVVGPVTAGDKAVLHNNGFVSGVKPNELITWNRAANPEVGTFRTRPDENGFVRLHIDL